jgi:hypothetical protein
MDAKRVASWDRRGIHSPAVAGVETLGMDVKRVAPWDRRGMKFPGYKTAPVETGWCVAAAPSPVDGAPFCSRAIDRPAVAGVETPGMDVKRVAPAVAGVETPGMDVKRVPPWDRRGMKFPGYKTAPVETGWRVAAAPSPVHGAPFCSRAIYRPAFAAVETPGMDVKRVAPWVRRGMKFPGYKTAPVETG